MKMLEDRIRKDGIVREGNVLKVDSFINHQMDIPLFREMAREWKRLFAGKPINKVLTIEASGIGIAAVVASELNVPVVFAHIIALNHDRMDSFAVGVVPFALVLGVVAVLMLLEPHLSGTVLILSIGAVLMFVVQSDDVGKHQHHRKFGDLAGL